MDQALESQSLEESYDLWKKAQWMVKTELPRMGYPVDLAGEH